MNFQKKSIILIFLFSLAFSHLFTQEIPQGTDLCDRMFTYLKKNSFHPQLQPLAAEGTNNYPYNIIVTFSPKTTQSDDNFILVLDIQDAWTNKEQLLPVLNALQSSPMESTVLLCYCSGSVIPRDYIIYGADIFARSVNTTKNNFAFLFNMSAGKNEIIAGTNQTHSPSWMLKDLFDSYSYARITEGLPVCYISQVSNYSFSTNHNIHAFQDADIPCIYGGIKDASKAPQIISRCIQFFYKTKIHQTDAHSFMFRLFNKRIWLSEYRIVNTIICFIIIAFILLFCVGFVNRTLRKEFWKEITANWYVLPVIYALTLTGFFAGKGLYALFVPATNQKFTVFGFIILQIFLSMIFVSAFYMVHLSLKQKYTTRSLDFILVIDTFINLVLFTLTDISLFPIFMLIFLISLVSLLFRRNWIHIILFIFLIIPFIPYINALYTISDTNILHKTLVSSISLPFVMSVVMVPLYLMNLRILNAVKKRYPKKRLYAIIISSSYIVLIILLLVLNAVFYSGKAGSSNPVTIIKAQTGTGGESLNDISLSYSDKTVFSDIIRSIQIKTTDKPEYVSIKVSNPGNTGNPILYSDNDFISEQSGTSLFLIPLYPPSELKFTYGTNDEIQIITVEMIFHSAIDNTYYSQIKTLTTEGIK